MSATATTGPTPTPTLKAKIGFTLLPSRCGPEHDEASYMTYVPGRSKPDEKVEMEVKDLRPDLDGPVGGWQQIQERGFAVVRHESEWVGKIGEKRGIEGYLREAEGLLKDLTGCTRAIARNSVCRKNAEDMAEKQVERQTGPEEGLVPTGEERMQPVAPRAHVDQGARWGFELCGKCIGTPADQFKRVAIINLWRPLHGPVTNAPLAMLNYRTLLPESIGVHAHQYGDGYDIHHHPAQEWGYVRHQMPDEVVWLKCYDSDQGKEGEALFGAHVAVQVEGDGIDGVEERGRESVEVRLVAVWE